MKELISLGTYLKLSNKDFYLYDLMDGTRTVQELLVEYFKKFKTFSFSRVGTLIEQLREYFFLTDRPVRIFSNLKFLNKKKQISYKLEKIIGSFLRTEIAIEGMDNFFEKLYRGFFWIFFTRFSQIFLFAIALFGFIAFLYVLHYGGYSIISHSLGKAKNSYGIGIIVLIFLNFIILIAHESAHAMTCKHYRKTVRKADFIFYYGTPAFFVDTTDIWMEGKGARIATSWAGPYANAILAGIASLIMLFFPTSLNPILFKFSFIAYLGLFLNLNPLLELDGYYILMDSLEIPLLRKIKNGAGKRKYF